MGNREGVQSIGKALSFLAFWLGVVICGLEQLLYWTVLRPYLLPLFHLSATAAMLCTMLICCYSAVAPLNSFATTMIVGVLRGGGDVRMSMFVDLLPLWCVTIPLLALTALVFHAPVLVVCIVMTSESVLKLPLGLWRLRSGKWVRDVTVS